MRKFTKEISALLASVAVGSAAFAGAVSASSELLEQNDGTEMTDTTTTPVYEETQTVGTMAGDDVSVTTTEAYEPTTETVGTGMPEDYWTTPIGTEIPEPVGTMMAAETTEPTEPPYQMTEMVGTMMAPDPSETTTTTAVIPEPIDLPPLAGDIAPADGDIDGDGELGVNDIVIFQKWLHDIPGTKIYDRWVADLNYDGELDIFDFALMKRRLIQNTAARYVEPDVKSAYGAPMHVLADGLRMYVGPDASYQIIGTIPQFQIIRETGYMYGNSSWILTEYNGRTGWIRMFENDDVTRTVEFELAADKPVIYLYPEQETDVHVELELTESELATTYPKYGNGWNVTAYPDGTLLNKADGTHHRYLFWDSTNVSTRFDFSKGFCVAGSDTEAFLKEKLTAMGLTEEERNEFIVYWLPRMEHNAFNLISFQGDAYTNSARLHITPEPDSICRVFMAYVPLEKQVEIEPQPIESFVRKGFTVLEWGGTEMPAPSTN